MPIIGLTHDKDGNQVLRRSITSKIAIGMPPDSKSKFPQRLDHFVFQRKALGKVDGKSTVAWELDTEKMQHYGPECREVWIVFLDDDPEQVFRTEYALWTRTHCACRGDGERATRKTPEHPDGQPWTPCANSGKCPQMEDGLCKPSGDLYFMLADFPTLGTISKLHTSSYQSIREISTALADLRMVTGGRLMGVKARLFVRPEKNVYRDKGGALMSSTKQVLGLELAARDLLQLTTSLTDTALLFDKVKLRLGARSVVIDEDEEEAIAGTINAEFYPGDKHRPAEGTVMEAAPGQKESRASIAAESEDVRWLRENHKEFAGEYTSDDPIGRPEARVFHAAWSKAGKSDVEVRAYLSEVLKVPSSMKIPRSRFPAALRWASGSPAAPTSLETKDEDVSPEEMKVRDAFSALQVPLQERRELLEQFSDQDLVDWTGVLQEINRRADGTL